LPKNLLKGKVIFLLNVWKKIFSLKVFIFLDFINLINRLYDFCEHFSEFLEYIPATFLSIL